MKERKYWLNKLAGELVKTHFPYDYRKKRMNKKNTVMESVKNVTFRFPGPLYAKMMKLSGGADVKLHMILVTGMFVLLHKYTGNNDIMIGSPIFKQEIEGEFINIVLVFRNETAAYMSFKELLQEVRNTIIEADENQNYPLEVLSEELNMPVIGDEFPLFDMVLLLENLHNKNYLQGICYNMLFSFSRTVDHIEGVVEYNSLLYREDTVGRIVDHYLHILDQALTGIDLPLYDLDLLSDRERQQLVCDFNNTEADYPRDKLLHRLFEAQVERTPDKIVVVGESLELDVFMPLTYGELNTRADQLAQALREKGVEPDTIVALMVEPSIEMMISILGILKSGGAYLPIDPEYPQERIDYILKDSSAKILLTANEIASLSTECLFNSHHSSFIIHHSNQLSYLIFDVFVEEVFPVLSKGGRLVIPGRTEIVEIENLSLLIAEYRVTMIDCTPLLLNEFDKFHADAGGAALESVRTFISGGDVLKPRYVEHLIKTGRVYNTYGPTESTVCAAYYHYTGVDDDLSAIPIGKPISNYKIYILDEHRKPAPIGVAGELCVSGPGVVRGYLNRPELTSEKFIDLHHSSFDLPRIHHLKLYCTGDLARWLPDGNIEYLGRIDLQVKIRGYRIELREIEAQLAKHELVDTAVVIDRQEEDGDKYLCAYIVSREPFDLSTLRNYLLQRLPEYMIPAFFTPVDQIPVTPNGKVDRKALPAVKVTASKTYIAPGNKIEEKLVEIWAEILNLNREAISVESDFFELGGHSLKATVLASRIHKELGIKLPVLEIFRNQTIRKLSQHISLTTLAENRFVGIEPAEKKEYYVLSSVQRRMYFIFQLEEDTTVYNIPDIIPLEEEVDKERLEQTFNHLIRRHESFRTSFQLIDQEPVQRVHEEVEFKIEILGVRDQGLGASAFIRPFDLSRAPLLRVGLIKRGERNYLLLVDIHHIIMDAVSMDVLKGEFEKLYAGERGLLPMLNLQYKDYSQWQQSELERGAFKAQEKFWLENIAGELPVLRLPLDFPRPLAQSFAGNTRDFPIEEEKAQRLKKLVIQSGSTLYITLLAVFNLLLFKLSGQEDIIVGTVMAARRHADLQNIIGMFVNTLVMRNFPNAEKSFREFLEEVKQRTLAVYENQDYPFEELVEKVAVNRDIGRNPIFDVVYSLQNLPEQWNVTEYATYGYESSVAKFDMTLSAVEIGEKFSFSLEYCTLLFKEETIARFIGYFKNIICSIIENPSQRINDVEILSEVEKRQLLVDFNGANEQYPGDKTIPQLFQEQVECAPDRIAVFGSTVETLRATSLQITYRQLNEQSGRLAGLLTGKDVLADNIIGLMVDRSIETIIGIMGILKSGGAYLPIDPSYPQERIDYMLKDSGAKLLVTANNLEGEKVRRWEGEKVLLEEIFNSPGSSSYPLTFSPSYLLNSSNLAYIIYTSGSTGRPKGVMVEHRNVINLVYGLRERIYSKYSRNLDVALVAPFIFDASVKQVFGALLLGYSLYIVPGDIRFDGEKLFEYYMKYAIDISDGTPTHLRLLLECRSGNNLRLNIKRFLIGGEPLTWNIVEKLFAHLETHLLKITNVYGPTECCVDTTSYEISIENIGLYTNLPIGVPMPNQQVYIVGKAGSLQPLGVPGELCIGGNSVARGYLNNPELTAERFNRNVISQLSFVISSPSNLPNDQCLMTNDCFYRTGDLARWLEDGNIEFLGRIDQQVKIRGFRIEVEEIENNMLRHPGVKEVKVLDKTDNKGDKYLCAYIVPERLITGVEFKEYLSGRLPGYMIPTSFVLLDRIPLTINGKVERKAFPEPEITPGEEYIAPGNEIEEQIAAIWSEVLGIEKSKLSVNANFFDAGGHSLKMMIMVARIHKVLNLKLELMQIFQNPTIRGIASLIEALLWVNDQEPGSDINGEHESEETII
ncbi:MAG: amino acid adenylation domain-containing protein [Candidatus Aminicenantes bacterium]|nr:amino acid adenylation domain-containing protein [Candidatus Aminicenantes bacterium]